MKIEQEMIEVPVSWANRLKDYVEVANNAIEEGEDATMPLARLAGYCSSLDSVWKYKVTI